MPDESTPPFLAWCLVHPCPLRPAETWDQPLRTERFLKSLRAVYWAETQDHVFEGICLEPATARGHADPPLGFPRDEVLRRFRGRERITEACGACPANLNSSLSPGPPPAWADCFGWVILDQAWEGIPEAFTQSLAQEAFAGAQTALSEPPSAWLNLLTASPHQGVWLAAAAEALEQAITDTGRPNQTLGCSSTEADKLGIFGASRWIAAMRQAGRNGLALAHELVPAGMTRGRQWIWPARCATCQTAWPDRQPRCLCCGRSGPPLPGKTRKTRGTRPFFPLEILMGSQAAEQWLDRYRATRATTSGEA